MRFSRILFEGCSYVGIALSLLIARNLHRMEDKSFLSKMFFAYFAIDFVMGLMEKSFHFVVLNGRYIQLYFDLRYNYCKSKFPLIYDNTQK